MKIHPDTLRRELDQISELLDNWRTFLKENDIPGIEVATTNEVVAEMLLIRMKSELQLTAERIMAVVEVME